MARYLVPSWRKSWSRVAVPWRRCGTRVGAKAGQGRRTLAPMRDQLEEAPERTLALVESVSDDDLNRVHDPLMSPARLGPRPHRAFEDLWLAHRTPALLT